jgi:hypothetical protein
VQALIADPQPTPTAPSPEVVAAPRACDTCATPLAAEQDWCLECGTGMPRGSRPGWRPIVGVLGTTLLLVGGALTASYAALSAKSRRATANDGSTLAQVPLAPTKTADQQPTGFVTETVAAAAARRRAAAPPAATAAAKPAKPATKGKAKAAPVKTARKPKALPKPTGPLRALSLGAGAASIYNPYGRPDSDFTSSASAVDGNPGSSWTAAVGPNGPDKMAVGLDLDLERTQGVRALEVVTSTPGMTVEIYGARGSQPVSIVDPAWIHLTSTRDLGRSQRLSLGDGGSPIRHLLVWITQGPPQAQKVALSELKVYR